MKIIERLDLVSKIGRELQSRMTFDEIDSYFDLHGISRKGITLSTNSKWVYVKDVLSKAHMQKIFNVAKELEIPVDDFEIDKNEVSANFWKAGHLKVFLSHLSIFKKQTAMLQKALLKYGITAFVAHEDITPSKEWQNEIEAALLSMDVFVAILMDGFKESDWCDQEIGVAVGRKVLIIPIIKDLYPYGFISKYQGVKVNNLKVGDVAGIIFKIIVNSEQKRFDMLKALSNCLLQTTDISMANERLEILKGVEGVPKDIYVSISEQIFENKVVCNDNNFMSSLDEILRAHGLEITYDDNNNSSKKIENDDLPF